MKTQLHLTGDAKPLTPYPGFSAPLRRFYRKFSLEAIYSMSSLYAQRCIYEEKRRWRSVLRGPLTPRGHSMGGRWYVA